MYWFPTDSPRKSRFVVCGGRCCAAIYIAVTIELLKVFVVFPLFLQLFLLLIFTFRPLWLLKQKFCFCLVLSFELSPRLSCTSLPSCTVYFQGGEGCFGFIYFPSSSQAFILITISDFLCAQSLSVLLQPWSIAQHNLCPRSCSVFSVLCTVQEIVLTQLVWAGSSFFTGSDQSRG